jgi:hypothetical protein
MYVELLHVTDVNTIPEQNNLDLLPIRPHSYTGNVLTVCKRRLKMADGEIQL